MEETVKKQLHDMYKHFYGLNQNAYTNILKKIDTAFKTQEAMINAKIDEKFEELKNIIDKKPIDYCSKCQIDRTKKEINSEISSTKTRSREQDSDSYSDSKETENDQAPVRRSGLEKSAVQTAVKHRHNSDSSDFDYPPSKQFKKVIRCAWCTGNHFDSRCDVYATAMGRIAIAMKKNLCLGCLKHTAHSKCYLPTPRCRCGGAHAYALCHEYFPAS